MPDGRRATLLVGGLNYSMLGTWDITAKSIDNYHGTFVSGYQSNPGVLPTIGTATYKGGTVVGTLYATSDGVRSGTLEGEPTLNVNFLTNTFTGSLDNMVVKDVTSKSAAPWNTVNFTGSLVGVNLVGTTTTSGAPSNTLAFSSSSTGSLNGSMFGPKAEEVGAVWTLHDPNGPNARTAVGAFVAIKQ